MKKHLAVIFITVLLMVVGLNGCNEIFNRFTIDATLGQNSYLLFQNDYISSFTDILFWCVYLC